FQAEDGIRDLIVTGVQTCALPISWVQDRSKLRVPGSTSICICNTDGARLNRPTSAGPGCIRVGSGLTPPAIVRSGQMRWQASRRSEERRVGKECRARGARGHLKKE